MRGVDSNTGVVRVALLGSEVRNIAVAGSTESDMACFA